jgi:hypothetical protein
LLHLLWEALAHGRVLFDLGLQQRHCRGDREVSHLAFLAFPSPATSLVSAVKERKKEKKTI